MINFAFMNKAFLISILLFLFNQGFTQETSNKKKDDDVTYNNALIITPIIQVNMPAADLAKRFGAIFNFGAGVDYKFGKNIYVGAEGAFMFGPKAKETEHIRNTLAGSGLIITDEGALDDVNLSMRGTLIKATVGKSFYFNKAKPSNGILLKFGAGYLHHKILIDVNKRVTPQLSGDYAKGYDRFSNGILLSQYVGLVKLEKGKYVNLSLGIEISEAFTSNSRPHDFYLNKKMTDKRVDLMFGLKMTWMIPVYLGQSSTSDYYYY